MPRESGPGGRLLSNSPKAFIDAVRSGLYNYVNFRGRSSRSEFWYWIVFTLLALIAILSVEALVGRTPVSLIALYGLVPPYLSVFVRRLHDVGKSGWTLLIVYIPIIGLYVIYLLVQSGEPLPNKYGLSHTPVDA